MLLPVFCCYSATYESVFRKYLEPSIPPSMELHATQIPERFNAMTWQGSADWYAYARLFFCDLVTRYLGQDILICGVDQRFFGDPVPDLLAALDAGNDMAMPNDWQPGLLYCCDFKVIRCSNHTLAFLGELYDNVGQYIHDQAALNALLPSSGLRVAVLSHDKFWNISAPGAIACVHAGGLPAVPSTVLWFHANHVVGVEAKLRLLEHVRPGAQAVPPPPPQRPELTREPFPRAGQRRPRPSGLSPHQIARLRLAKLGRRKGNG